MKLIFANNSLSAPENIKRHPTSSAEGGGLFRPTLKGVEGVRNVRPASACPGSVPVLGKVTDCTNGRLFNVGRPSRGDPTTKNSVNSKNICTADNFEPSSLGNEIEGVTTRTEPNSIMDRHGNNVRPVRVILQGSAGNPNK